MDTRILKPACAAMLMLLGSQVNAETVVPTQGQTAEQVQADTAACQAQAKSVYDQTLAAAHQSAIRLMYQGRGLQRLARFFLRQLGSRQLPEFVIHERQQLLGRRRIAGFNLRQNASDVRHGQGLEKDC